MNKGVIPGGTDVLSRRCRVKRNGDLRRQALVEKVHIERLVISLEQAFESTDARLRVSGISNANLKNTVCICWKSI